VNNFATLTPSGLYIKTAADRETQLPENTSKTSTFD
jgi:hypothetical protein